MVVEPRLEAVDVQLRGGLARVELLGHVLVDPLGRVPRLIEGHGADGDQEREPRPPRRSCRRSGRTAPRGIRSRVRSRTSGFSVNAITLAVRKRKRTCPSLAASRNARTRRTGRPTSWIHRGTSIVGPQPAMRGSYRDGLRVPDGPCFGPGHGDCDPALPARRAARADRRRAQALARCSPSPSCRRSRGGDTRVDGVRRQQRSARASAGTAAARYLRSARAQVLATVGNLRRSPRSLRGRDRRRISRGRGRRARPEARRPAANEGLLARLWHRITGASRRARLVPALGRGTLRTRRGRGHRNRCLRPGRRNCRGHPRSGRLRAQGRGRDRASAHVGTVPRRRHRERQARPRARWGKRRRGILEARNRHRHQPLREAGARAIRRRRRQQRLDPGLPSATLGVPYRLRALRILFIADVVGAPGRGALDARLKALRCRARDRRLHRERGERGRRHRDHAASRRSASRDGRRRDHARQPCLQAHRDRRLPRLLRSRRPAREHVDQHARTGSRDRPDGERLPPRGHQRPRLSLPPSGDVDVRAHRRPRRAGPGGDAARPRRRACGGDQREGCARPLARRTGDRGGRHAHPRPDLGCHGCCPAAPPSSRTRG